MPCSKPLLYLTIPFSTKAATNKSKNSKPVFQTREKEQAIQLRDAQLARQQMGLMGAGLILTLFAILVVVVVRNNRQRRKTNEILSEQAVQLKSLDATKSRFFANISHEFRTPLTLILSPTGKCGQKDESESPAG